MLLSIVLTSGGPYGASPEPGGELEQPPADSAARAAFFSQFQAAYEELRRRLLAEPQVSRVTFATRVPGMEHDWPSIEVDTSGVGAPGAMNPKRVMNTGVDVNFFDALGAEIVAGRGFNSAELGSDPGVVVVNEDFVTEILQGRNAIGRRFRYRSRYGQRNGTGQPRGLARALMLQPGRWYEIVGVVTNLGMDTRRDPFASGTGPGVYHVLQRDAMGPGSSYSVRMAFHVRGAAASFAPRLREVAHTVDSTLRLYDVLPLGGPVDRASRNHRPISNFFASATALVTLIAIFVSAAGTYSLMSFTVSRRTREIGIMTALGADRRRILAAVFSRSIAQIGTGVLVGGVICVYILVFLFGIPGSRAVAGLFLPSAAVLMLVGLVACGLPVRRALRIEPTEALKEVG